MAKQKNTKAEKIAKIPIEKISKMSNQQREQLEDYVRTLRAGYKRRVGAFHKKGLVSHAQISFESSISNKKQVPLKKMTRNQLLLEFARYSKFFNDITSTEEGIKQVNREQDVRIFGSDSKGKPKATMTNEQRARFWSLYDEYNNVNPGGTSKYGSESIQQQLASALFSDESIDTENIVGFLDDLDKRLQEQYGELNLGSVPNVYSGRGPNI